MSFWLVQSTNNFSDVLQRFQIWNNRSPEFTCCFYIFPWFIPIFRDEKCRTNSKVGNKSFCVDRYVIQISMRFKILQQPLCSSFTANYCFSYLLTIPGTSQRDFSTIKVTINEKHVMDEQQGADEIEKYYPPNHCLHGVILLFFEFCVCKWIYESGLHKKCLVHVRQSDCIAVEILNTGLEIEAKLDMSFAGLSMSENKGGDIEIFRPNEQFTDIIRDQSQDVNLASSICSRMSY